MTEESKPAPRTITVQHGENWAHIAPADGLPRATNGYWSASDQTPHETHTIIVQYVGHPDAITARAKSDWLKHKQGIDMVDLVTQFGKDIAKNEGTEAEHRDAAHQYALAISKLRNPAPTRQEQVRSWRKVTA